MHGAKIGREVKAVQRCISYPYHYAVSDSTQNRTRGNWAQLQYDKRRKTRTERTQEES